MKLHFGLLALSVNARDKNRSGKDREVWPKPNWQECTVLNLDDLLEEGSGGGSGDDGSGGSGEGSGGGFPDIPVTDADLYNGCDLCGQDNADYDYYSNNPNDTDSMYTRVASDGRSGIISSQSKEYGYLNNVRCQTTIETQCDNVVFKFNFFDLDACYFDYAQIGSPSAPATPASCGGIYNFGNGNNGGDYYDDYYSNGNYPTQYHEWTPIGSSDLVVAFYADGSYRGAGFLLEFKCLEDVFNLPECSVTNTEFGGVNYLPSGNTEYTSSDDINVRQVDVPEENCAQTCWEHAGCTKYFYNGECNFIIGHGYSLGTSNDITSSGALNNFCPENPFIGTFTKVSQFYCKFLTALETATLIDSIKEINNVDDADVLLGDWMFFQSKSVVYTSVSSFVNLEIGTPSGEALPQGDEAGWTWIRFEVRTHVRVCTQVFLRTTYDINNALNDIANVDDNIIAALETNLELPPEATLDATTPVETVEFAILSEEGESAGDCSASGCDCDDGFTEQEDGKCKKDLKTEDFSDPIDCYDGNNGGCSHYCNQEDNKCECPTCWNLQADETSCKPREDKISMTCTGSSMMIEVDECIYSDGTETVTIGFTEDAECQSTFVNGTTTVMSDLDKCGTVASSDSGNIIFTNTLMVTDRVHPLGLSFNNDVTVDVSCTFSATVADVTADVNITGKVVETAGPDGTGNFDFTAQYYADGEFSAPTSDDDVMVVGELLHFGISPDNIISGVSFYVSECIVSDVDTNTYKIVEDMCPNIFVVKSMGSFTNTELFTLNYYAFHFSAADINTETHSMDITCNIMVCLDGNCPEDPTC